MFYERTMHFTCKKRDPPPAKADCVSASGKTRPFAPTARADFQALQLWKTISFTSTYHPCESFLTLLTRCSSDSYFASCYVQYSDSIPFFLAHYWCILILSYCFSLLLLFFLLFLFFCFFALQHRNLQHFWAQTASPSFWCYNFAAKIATNKMWNLGAV